MYTRFTHPYICVRDCAYMHAEKLPREIRRGVGSQDPEISWFLLILQSVSIFCYDSFFFSCKFCINQDLDNHQFLTFLHNKKTFLVQYVAFEFYPIILRLKSFIAISFYHVHVLLACHVNVIT